MLRHFGPLSENCSWLLSSAARAPDWVRSSSVPPVLRHSWHSYNSIGSCPASGRDTCWAKTSVVAKTYQRFGCWLSECEIQTPEGLVCKPDARLSQVRAAGSGALLCQWNGKPVGRVSEGPLGHVLHLLLWVAASEQAGSCSTRKFRGKKLLLYQRKYDRILKTAEVKNLIWKGRDSICNQQYALTRRGEYKCCHDL